MSDKEEPQPRSPRKHPHSNRARPGQSRMFPHLGVSDLRQIIERRRGEKGYSEPGIPPPDPSYNYLKDPMRESEDNEQLRQSNSRRPKNHPNSFRRDKEHKGSPSNYQKPKDIEHPLNIKVEFSTSTGEHSYQLDQSTVLPTIKHVPDHTPVQNRPFRGRGRGRGRGSRNYQTRTIRNNKRYETPSTAEIPNANVEEDWDQEINEKKEEGNEAENPEEEVPNEEVQQNDLNIQQNEEVGLEKHIEGLKLQDEEVKQDEESKEVKL